MNSARLKELLCLSCLHSHWIDISSLVRAGGTCLFITPLSGYITFSVFFFKMKA